MHRIPLFFSINQINRMESNDSRLCYVLPPHSSLYPLQVAGHIHGEGQTKLGLLKHENGNILKPLIKDDKRSAKELSFYENVFENCQSDSLIQKLKCFLPKFYGTWETSIAGQDIKYLRLEDVCEHFQKPSVLDVKIGVKTYDPEASEEKLEAEKKKYPAAEVLGFRILGMKVYEECKQLYMCKNKNYGKEQTPETITFALDQYLKNNHGQVNCLILCGFIHNMLHLIDWFSEQRILAFYSSSLLFVYEGVVFSWAEWIENNLHTYFSFSHQQNETLRPYHNSVLNSDKYELHIPSGDLFPDIKKEVCPACGIHRNICSKVQTGCSLYRIVMIDFAHTYQTTKEDSNYVFGLKMLLEKFKELLKLYREKYSSCNVP